MNRFIPGPLPEHARNLLRRAGYGEHIGHGGQMSFDRRFENAPFPKYHAYVEERDGGLQVNLHIDQKAASHDSGRAHAGEYEGPLVEQELDRLAAFVESLRRQADAGKEENYQAPTKRWGFWN